MGRQVRDEREAHSADFALIGKYYSILALFVSGVQKCSTEQKLHKGAELPDLDANAAGDELVYLLDYAGMLGEVLCQLTKINISGADRLVVARQYLDLLVCLYCIKFSHTFDRLFHACPPPIGCSVDEETISTVAHVITLVAGTKTALESLFDQLEHVRSNDQDLAFALVHFCINLKAFSNDMDIEKVLAVVLNKLEDVRPLAYDHAIEYLQPYIC